MIRGTKAGVQWPLVALFFLLGVVLLVSNGPLTSIKNTLGENQYRLLQQTQKAVTANEYIDQSATFSTALTKDVFLQSAGIYQQISKTGGINPSPCGNYLYPNYKSKNHLCIPKYSTTIKNYFDDFFFTYLQQYPSNYPLYFLYDLSFVTPSKKELVLQATGDSVSIPFKLTTTSKQTGPLTCQQLLQMRKSYPKTALGFYTKEKPIPCSTGECFAQVANLLYETYKTQNKKYDYVPNGESPYCPQDVWALAGQTAQANSLSRTSQTSTTQGSIPQATSSLPTITPDPFFSGITIPADRFLQREQEAPGFDSSGWLWWVGKHADISFFDKRLEERPYLDQAKQQNLGSVLCKDKACSLSFLNKNIQPGDVLFVADSIKTQENGMQAAQGAIQMALYIETDQTNGKLIIIHADSQKGLVKEFLPDTYATSKDTTIAAVFRPNYKPSGNAVLPPDLHIIPPFIGPFEWCNGKSSSSPSSTYISQLQAQPFKSTPTTYYDLIIQTALQQGIDPALLATHMVLESSLGQNDKCHAQQKSSLTGCNWFPSCSSKCACTSPAVVSDEAQAECTATTDTAAYKEAITGKDTLKGKYDECNAYKDNPELFWNCIFCIYQGSYDKVIGSGKRYFQQDKTCDYAEKAKGIYCSWRDYFDAHWNDLSSLSSLQVTSKLSFTPAFRTTTSLDLNSLNLITQEFIPSLQTCDDNLKQCVQSKISLFNQKHSSDIQITRLQNDNAFANDFVEQLLDCRFNEQKNCICPIKPFYTGFGDKDQTMSFSFNGTFLAQGKKIYSFNFNPAIPTKPVIVINALANLAVSGNEKASMYFHYLDKNKQAITTIPWNLQTVANPTYANPGKDVLAFGLLKQTYSSMTWLPYEQKVTHLTCRNDKHYFSFQAKLQHTGNILNFSFYLEDTQPPHIQPTTSTTIGTCLETPTLPSQQSSQQSNPLPALTGQAPLSSLLLPGKTSFTVLGVSNTVTMQWKTANSQEPLYAFIIETATDSSFTQIVGRRKLLVATAKLLTTPQQKVASIEQLAVQKGTQDNMYFFKTTTEDAFGKPYLFKTTYYYRIIPVDNYENEGVPTQVATFTLSNPFTSTLPLSKDQIALLQAGKQVLLQGTSNLICAYNQNTFITVDDLLPKVAGNLKIYPGLINPENKAEPLYQITGIPGITCDESQSHVGEICAGNQQLVTALQKLSSDLQQRAWSMIIPQAFRTWDIQYALWAASGFDSTMACNPRSKNKPYLCPHMQGGAIDISIKDASGKQIPYVEQEEFMCQYGFVRYGREWWHFEMGTPKWALAENARKTGACCYYGARHPDDTRGQQCNI